LEENKAKVAEPEEVSSFVENFFKSSNKLLGKKFLITAGPTREWIDSVRFLSNPSSGKMGIAITQAVLSSGAEVSLLLGPTNIRPAPHPNLRVLNPVSTVDFVHMMEQELDQKIDQKPYDVLISTAALSDFTPVERVDQKISSDSQEITLNLISTPKLIKKARKKSDTIFIVGFKAESLLEDQELIDKAYQRLQDSNINLIIANKVHPSLPQQGFGAENNEVYVINQQKEIIHLPIASKNLIAQQILEKIIEEMKK
ncbi:MAG: phosphopantothenoylcysteine decarboxylase domain-containing protein, partial [Promethearchaeota archaeon]